MKIIFTAFLLLFSSLLSANPINKIVVFGDSLSDNGNFYEYMKGQFPKYPYHEGRFSNGPVWIEHVAEMKGVPLENYAYGGAGVLGPEEDEDSALFHLRQEVSSYLLANGDHASDDVLYVVWIGANNYLAMPEDEELALQVVLNGVKAELKRLAESGAKHFLVANLPDLGVTPAAYMSEANEMLSALSTEHNVRLREALTNLEAEYPGVQWVYLNVGQLFFDVFLSPESFGIEAEKMKDTCVENYADPEQLEIKPSMLKIAAAAQSSRGEGEDENPCAGYLFFDLVHPTAHAHKTLAGKTTDLLDSLGLEFKAQSAA